MKDSHLGAEYGMNIRAKVYRGFSTPDDPILKDKKPKGAKADTLTSVAVPREARRLSNSRGEDRHRLSNERAQITHKGKKFEVDLINLSGGGAMVSGSFEPLMWDRVDLHLGNHGTIECRVRWVRDNRAGLEFAHETRLDWPSDQVAIVLRHVIERTFPHIAFPESDEPGPPKAEEPRTDEHRIDARHPLIWNGVLHHDFESNPVRVRNISSTGAMIEIKVPIPVGAEPLLEISDSTSVAATVEWAVGDQAGLKFHSPFDLRCLVESRPSIATNDWSPPTYFDPDAVEDTGSGHWNRLSLSQLRQELEGFLKR